MSIPRVSPSIRLVACLWLIAAMIVLSWSRRARATEGPQPAAGPTQGGPTIFVELRANDPRVRLERMIGDRATQTVCQAPCGRALDPRALYVIDGEGVPRTSTFTLPLDRHELTLTVDRGSRAEWFAGIGLLAGGSVATVAGYLFAPHPEDPNGPALHESPAPLLIGLGGLVVCLVGTILLLDAPTRVHSSTGRSFL